MLGYRDTDMNNSVVSNAIGGLDKILSVGRDALWEISRDMFVGGGDDNEPVGGFADPEAALGGSLEELYDILLVVLEAAELPATKTALVKKWPEFGKATKGLRHTYTDHEFEYCRSDAFDYLDRLVKALRMTVVSDLTSEEAWTLRRLEAMLNDTDNLLHRKKFAPANEIQLQNFMHDYLRACFPDFRHNPKIGGSIKNFIPDCGIASVNAAIEFKIAHTEQQAIAAFTGVVEDVGGYKGSKEWTRFYAVMYQAKPFISKSQLDSDMKRIKAATWKAILLHGQTAPKVRRKFMAPASTRRKKA